MSRRKLIILTLVLLAYLAVVWILSYFVLRSNYVLLACISSVCGLTIAAVYWLIAANKAPFRPSAQTGPADIPRQNFGQSGPDRQFQELLTEANRKLANSPRLASERVKPRVADLPLFLLTGIEASGKTSMFMQAGLEAESLSGQVQRGDTVVPTQLANFWFARGAVVAEIAGNVFSGESSRWMQIVSALRGENSPSFLRQVWGGSKARQSMQGVILCIDVKQFGEIPETTMLAGRARLIRERLQSLGRAFASDFPVWVLFTKADSIPFFADYFNRLRRDEEQQPLGCAFSMLGASERPTSEPYTEAETRRIEDAFNSLYRSLASQRITLLARESNPSRSLAAYEFPREFKRSRVAIVQFLVDVFRPNHLQPGPLLRGFYFTGIRKVLAQTPSEAVDLDKSSFSDRATVILKGDDLRAQIERAVSGRPAAPNKPAKPQDEYLIERCAFVSQILGNILGADNASTRRYESRSKKLSLRLVLSSIVSFCLLLLIFVLNSAWSNHDLLKRVETAGTNLQLPAVRNAKRSVAQIRALDNLRQRLEDLAKYQESRPWHMRFFLYSGGDIEESARKAYFVALKDFLLIPMASQLVREFEGLPQRIADDHPYEPTYSALEDYVTITNQCDASVSAAQSLTQRWSAEGHQDAETNELVRTQFAYYVRELHARRVPVAVQPNEPAMDNAKRYLENFGPESRLYRALLDRINRSELQPARLSDYTKHYPETLTGISDVPAAFTRDGWKAMQEQIASAKPEDVGDSCVLQRKPGRAGLTAKMPEMLSGMALQNDLRRMYAGDFVKQWKDFLSNTKFLKYRDTQDAANKLSVLDQDLTLLGLFYMVDENTSISSSASTESKLIGIADSSAGNLGGNSAIGRLAKTTADRISRSEANRKSLDPESVFQPVRSLFCPEANRERWNCPATKDYVDSIGALKASMSDLSKSQHPDTDMTLNAAAKKAVDDGLRNVGNMAHGFDRGNEDVNQYVVRLLNAPFDTAKDHYVEDFGKETAAKMNAAAAAACQKMRTLLQEYPFNPSTAAKEATAEEVASVFSPQTGALWAFYHQNLEKYVAKQGHRYEPRADAPQDVKVDPLFLDNFNHAAQITEALFVDGSATPAMRYKLNVLPNPDLKGVTLTVDGQMANSGSHEFLWPGSAQGLSLNIQSGDADFPVASYAGLWSIFEMMAETDPRAPGSREAALSKVRRGQRGLSAPIRVGQKEITVRLRIEEFPGGVEAAFDKGFFACKCLGKAVQ
jgi:type VI secretion system protein ImpL